MSDELTRLAPEIVIAGIICGAVVAIVIGREWAKVRRNETELEFTRHLVDQGMSVEEIERLLAKRTPPPRGLLEQFGALSRGTKLGLVFLGFMFCGLLMSTVNSYIFWVARK
jgi:hypothetical protein